MCKYKKKVIKVAENAPAAIGPYSLGVKTSHFFFSAGQLGINPSTGKFVEGGIQGQTRQALKNLQAVLATADLDLSQVVKVTVFLEDINDFSSMNEVYAEFFKEDPPARSAVQVAALPKGGLVEIEVIAVLSNEDCGK
ncbi:MAG TPA: RidA family protein [Anaerolineae bacterium]|nr:RidA family protein [Anaerolineae bacterium]